MAGRESGWCEGPLQPLRGVNVLDFSRHLPGPWLTRILADLGATVIKIESPRGDPTRMVPPFVAGMAALYATANANKHSVSVNLRAEEGRALLRAMVPRVDVLVESFRAGVLGRMGLDDETLETLNPRLIVCSLTGFGQKGPDAQRAGHDINFLARAGLLSQSGPEGATPVTPFVQVADIAGGSLPGVIGILGALMERAATGRGRRLDVSLTHGAAGIGVFAHALASGGMVEPGGAGMLTGGLPCYRCYPTADGKALALGALEPHFFQAFCERIDRPDLASRGIIRGDSAIAEIEAITRTRTRDEWVAHFAGVDCCLEPVLTPDEAQAQLQSVVEMVAGRPTVRLDVGAPAAPARPPENLGQSGAAIIESLGVEGAVLQAALACGALNPGG
ncbi:MAG: CaiB/BaiF CoA-transferase family protein [Myxococcota bacterium]